MRQTKLRMSAAILTFCGLVNGFAQNIQGEAGKWTFIGQLTNPEKTLFVAPLDNLEDRVEVVKENGCFTFTTDLDVAMDYMIFSSAAEKKNKGGISILVTAVPGEVLTARGFCDNNKPADGLTFGGTPFYRDYTLIHTICADVQEQEDAQRAVSYIKSHPDNEMGALLVSYVGYYDPDRLKETLALLSPEVRNGRMKAYIDKELDEAAEYVRQKEMNEKLPVGSIAPDFTLDDLYGQPLTLSSLRGKYLILDFWGTWCGWCIDGFPQMKKYYNKYKDKMEILGMDCSDTKAKWKRFVEENALPWLHVFVPKGSDITDVYRISAFPTKIIISPEGKVVNTVIGENAKFYELLDELFKSSVK